MEFSGDGVVAIVQALCDAGLALAEGHSRPRSIEINNSLLTQKCSSAVQTNIEGVHRHSRDRTLQIRDGYTSSYQLAHCRLSPSSQPVRSKEFPPQNDRFCPYQGNFEVDRYGSYSGDLSPVRDGEQFRSDGIWTEKGIPLSRASPTTDAFAESLRKYPSSPERCPFDDVIQRLLAYTQAKYLAKSKRSFHSKSMRSLTRNVRESKAPTDKKLKESSTKDMHTTQSVKREFDISTNTEPNKSNMHRPFINHRKNYPTEDFVKNETKKYSVIGNVFNSALNKFNDQIPIVNSASNKYSDKISIINEDINQQSDQNNVLNSVPTEDTIQRHDIISNFNKYCAPKPVNNSNTKYTVQRPVVNNYNSNNKTPRQSRSNSPMACNESLNIRKNVLHTPRSNLKNLRLKDSQVDPSYNYLNSTRRHSSNRTTEVRYLDDLGKYVADTLKNIYGNRNIVCPEIAKRYSHHRRLCPKHQGQTSADSVNTETQTRMSPRESRDASTLHRSSSPPLSQHSYRASCCDCQKSRPCDCRRSSFNRKSNFKVPKGILSPATCKFSLYINDEEKIEDETCRCRSEEVNRKIEDQVFKWLKNIPVTADCKPENKAVREEMAKDLVEKLNDMKDDANFENYAKEEILKCLTYMPMWYPDIKDKDSFRNEITRKLLDNLINIMKKPDEFENTIAKWVMDLPLKRSDVNDKDVDTEKIKDYVVNKLRTHARHHGSNGNELKHELRSEINEILHELPIDIKKDVRMEKTINQLADKLVKELVVLSNLNLDTKDRSEKEVTTILQNNPDFDALDGLKKQKLGKLLKELQSQGLTGTEIQERINKAAEDMLKAPSYKNKLVDKFEGEVKNWINVIPELSDMGSKETIQKLTNNLANIAAEGIEDEDVQNEIKTETKKWLNYVSKRADLHVEPNRENILIDDLLDRLISIKDQTNNYHDPFYNLSEELLEEMSRPPLKRNITNQIKNTVEGKGLSKLETDTNKKINDWLDDIPELAHVGEKNEFQKTIQNLTDMLVEMQNQSRDNEDVRHDVEEEIKTWLNSVLKNEGVQMSFNTKANCIKKLFEQIVNEAPNSQKMNNLDNKIKSHPITKLGENISNKKDYVKNHVDYRANHSLDKKIELKQIITKWLNNIPVLSTVSNKKPTKDKIEKLTTNILSLQRSHDISSVERKDKTVKDIKEFLDSILENEGVRINVKDRTALINNLANDLVISENQSEMTESMSKRNKSTKRDPIVEFENIIADWIYNIPEISNALYNDDNLRAIKNLANNISKEIVKFDEGKIKHKILRQITNFLDYILEKEGRILPSKAKHALTNDLINRLVSTLKAGERNRERSQSCQEKMLHWLDEFLDDSDDKNFNQNNKQVMTAKDTTYIKDNSKVNPNPNTDRQRKQWDKRQHRSLQDSEEEFSDTNKDEVIMDIDSAKTNKYANYDEDDDSKGQSGNAYDNKKVATNSIAKPYNIYKSGTESAGTKHVAIGNDVIDRRTKPYDMYNGPSRKVNDKVYYIEKLKPNNSRRHTSKDPSISKDRQTSNVAIDTLESPNTCRGRVRNNTKKYISEVLDKNSDKIISQQYDGVKKEVYDILKRDGVPDDEAKRLADGIIKKAESVYDKGAAYDKNEIIRKEVCSVLNKYGIDDPMKGINDTITNMLADEIVRGKLDDQTRGSMYNILAEADVSHDVAESATNDIMQRAKIISQSIPGSSTTTTTKIKSNIIPMQKELVTEVALKENTNFVDDKMPDITPSIKEGILQATVKQVEKLEQVVSDPNFTSEVIKETTKNKHIDNFDQLPIEMNKTDEQLADQMLHRLESKLQNDGIITSTPRTSSFKSFPRNSTQGVMISSINDNDNSEAVNINEQRFTRQLQGIINSWITELPIIDDAIKDRNIRDAMVDDLASDIVDRQKYLQLNPEAKSSKEEEMEHLKYQTFRWLNRILDVNDLTPFLPNIADLMNKIEEIPLISLVKPSSKPIQDEINKFIKQIPSNQFKVQEKGHTLKMVKELGDRIMNDVNTKDTDKNIDKAIAQWVTNMFNVDESKLNAMTKTLKETMETNYLLDNKKDSKFSKKAADMLYDTIESWCDDLPIYGGESVEDQQKIKILKQNLAGKLINKIGELNLNPEVFNDDFLYDDLLMDEIDKLLETMPKNSELEIYLPSLKRDLISHVKEARKKIMDELVGQTYKQQLRDTVLKFTCLPECLAADELASFELLKDNLVDAFISLHFVSDNEQEKIKFKIKIADEVNRFCCDYIGRHPLSPIDPEVLNQELYNALLKVPVPKDGSLRTEIEQLKVKDVINEWVKDLPLKDDNISETLHCNKMVSILTKRLYAIEKEKEFNPEFDFNNKMFDEISKWLRKIALIPGNESKIPRFANILTEQMKTTEESRKNDSMFATPGCCCSSRCIPSPQKLQGSLNQSDEAHLNRIKDRVRSGSSCFKDVSVNCPTDCDLNSSTYPNHSNYPLCNIRQSSSQIPSRTKSKRTCDMCPQVIVKEYYWDSHSIESVKIPCTSSPRRPSQSVRSVPIKPSPDHSIISQPSACKCCHQQTEASIQSHHRSAEVSSAEDEEPNRLCKRDRRYSRGKRPPPSTDEEPEWSSVRFPNDTDFWDNNRCQSRVCVTSDMKPFTKEREKFEERHKCRCKERVKYSSCRSKGQGQRQKSPREQCCNDALKQKRCGANCPHPSYLYFR